MRLEDERSMKKEGKKDWREVAQVNFEQRLKELQCSLGEFEKKGAELPVKEADSNIDTMFEFLENEPKTSISKELPGDMYAVRYGCVDHFENRNSKWRLEF